MFEKKHRQGIELFLWCVKYGLLLYDKNYFIKFYSQPNIAIRQKDILTKRTLVNSLVIKIYEAIAIDDLTLAVKLIKNMSIQIARIFLISKNIIPRSRPELNYQLNENNSPFRSLIVSDTKLYEMSKQDLVEYTDTIYKHIDAYLNDYFSDSEEISGGGPS